MDDIATKLTTIAENQQKVHDAGYSKGYEAGRAEGGDTDAAYQQGVTDGKQAQYDAFWDAIQVCGNKTNYSNCFQGKYWTNELFKPKYAFIQTNTNYSSAFAASAITDLSEYTFIGTQMSNMFAGAAIVKIGTIRVNMPSIALTTMFSNCKNLQTIGSLELYPTGNTNTISFTNAFSGCNALRNINNITGVINAAISFVDCTMLTHDSLMCIINALCSSGNGKKLTLGSTNLAKLTEDEKAQITTKGWQYA